MPKGWALALDRPVSGLSTLAALARDVESGAVVWALIDARRGQIYGQPFQDGAPLADPAALTLEAAALRMTGTQARIAVGSGAALMPVTGVEAVVRAAPSPGALARLAADQPRNEARPLYLRAP